MSHYEGLCVDGGDAALLQHSVVTVVRRACVQTVPRRSHNVGPGADAAVLRLPHRGDRRRARHSRLLRERRRLRRALRLRREHRQVDR